MEHNLTTSNFNIIFISLKNIKLGRLRVKQKRSFYKIKKQNIWPTLEYIAWKPKNHGWMDKRSYKA